MLISGLLVDSGQLAQVTESGTILSTRLHQYWQERRHHPPFVTSARASIVTTTWGYWCLLSLKAEKDDLS